MASAPPPLAPEPAALSPEEEDFVIDLLSALAVLDDRQLTALVGPRRAAALRAIQHEVDQAGAVTAH